MPSILSKDLKAKLLGGEWSFGYNCYEVGHSWTPSCTDAALEVAISAASNVGPLYLLLYSFTQVGVQRKFTLDATWDTVKSTLRSTFFIFFHAYNGAAIGCGMRNGFGRFYYRVLVCLPGLLSSYLSLLIEKPARRQALAFYMLNLASEIVYRMAVTKGYYKPMKHGETLLFALSLAAWYHFIKVHGFGHDPVSAAVKVLIGRDEAKSRAKKSAIKSDTTTAPEQQKQQIRPVDNVSWYQRCYNYLLSRHSCCPHQGSSCLYYVLEPVPSRFLLGWAIQAVLGLTRNPYKLIQAPLATVRGSFMSRSSFRFGLFIMSLVSGGRLTNCLLRRISDSDQVWHGAASGFVAGLSMLLAPRSSLSMYIMWKAVEQYYLQLAREGKVKYKDFTILTIYAASASTILYTFALEPKFVRPSYMKFLDNLSNHRLHQLNRMVLDVFGTGSSVGYEDFFPDLDPKYMSNQFKELIFNWMIQPYE